MTASARRSQGVHLLAIGLVVVACTTAGPPLESAGPPSSSPSAIVALATSAATATAAVESVAPGTPPAISDAPLAFLVVGVDRQLGEVGGFTFGRYSQSAPWLPATALEPFKVPAAAELRVELDDRATIDSWVVRIATAEDVTADAVTGLAKGRGPAAAFRAPSPGDWVVSVTITYGDGLGSGAYFWHLIVE